MHSNFDSAALTHVSDNYSMKLNGGFSVSIINWTVLRDVEYDQMSNINKNKTIC